MEDESCGENVTLTTEEVKKSTTDRKAKKRDGKSRPTYNWMVPKTKEDG